jgi:hypothetical protein
MSPVGNRRRGRIVMMVIGLMEPCLTIGSRELTFLHLIISQMTLFLPNETLKI